MVQNPITTEPTEQRDEHAWGFTLFYVVMLLLAATFFVIGVITASLHRVFFGCLFAVIAITHRLTLVGFRAQSHQETGLKPLLRHLMWVFVGSIWVAGIAIIIFDIVGY